jgi:hypothetical protein
LKKEQKKILKFETKQILNNVKIDECIQNNKENNQINKKYIDFNKSLIFKDPRRIYIKKNRKMESR